MNWRKGPVLAAAVQAFRRSASRSLPMAECELEAV